MYALIRSQNPEALNLVANRKSRAYIPSAFMRSAFGDHINWPKDMLDEYDTYLNNSYKFFALPFLIHEDNAQIGELSQSMKAPDGSLEIFGTYEFQENQPEQLLKNFSDLARFIKESRQDALQ